MNWPPRLCPRGLQIERHHRRGDPHRDASLRFHYRKSRAEVALRELANAPQTIPISRSPCGDNRATNVPTTPSQLALRLMVGRDRTGESHQPTLFLAAASPP
jgi:hypothetical protein